MKIKIVFPYGKLKARIDKTKNPKTAKAVAAALPISGKANRWGDEIYFETSIKATEENSQEEVEAGDMAYWPTGRALCIFFGQTPVSTSDKPRAYSPVNVFGRVVDEAGILKKVKDGDEIRIEAD